MTISLGPRVRQARGFTLLEVLVWMAVAAVAISFVTLSVGSGSRPDQLKSDAEKLTGMIQLALEESVLTSRPMGLRFVQEYGARDLETRYEWSVFEQGKWQPLTGDSFFSDQQFFAGTEVEMRLEGRAADLAAGSSNKKNAKKQNETGKASAADQDPALQYKPDVFFLHSGEITPAFEIDLRVEVLAEQYQIAGNPVGQIRLRRRNSDSAEWL
ncbi:MAG: Tfp pilus assembly protein FimT/FimU [Pseudomonadales bacterium]